MSSREETRAQRLLRRLGEGHRQRGGKILYHGPTVDDKYMAVTSDGKTVVADSDEMAGMIGAAGESKVD